MDKYEITDDLLFQHCTNVENFILEQIPDEEDKYECGRFIFEIIDIDGHQIDKVLVTDLGPQDEEETEE